MNSTHSTKLITAQKIQFFKRSVQSFKTFKLSKISQFSTNFVYLEVKWLIFKYILWISKPFPFSGLSVVHK